MKQSRTRLMPGLAKNEQEFELPIALSLAYNTENNVFRI